MKNRGRALCAKRQSLVFSAISALMLPCVQQAQVQSAETTPSRPRRTCRAVGTTALTQRSQRRRGRREAKTMTLRAKHMTVVRHVRPAVPDGAHLASLARRRRESLVTIDQPSGRSLARSRPSNPRVPPRFVVFTNVRKPVGAARTRPTPARVWEMRARAPRRLGTAGGTAAASCRPLGQGSADAKLQSFYYILFDTVRSK